MTTLEKAAFTYLQAKLRGDIAEMLLEGIRTHGIGTATASPDIGISEMSLDFILKGEYDINLEEIIRIALWANKAPVLEFKDELTVSFP